MRRVGEVGEIKRDLTMVAVRGGEGSWTSTHMHAGLRAVNKELSLEMFLYLYLSYNLPTTMAGGQEKSFAEQMRFLGLRPGHCCYERKKLESKIHVKLI